MADTRLKEVNIVVVEEGPCQKSSAQSSCSLAEYFQMIVRLDNGIRKERGWFAPVYRE